MNAIIRLCKAIATRWANRHTCTRCGRQMWYSAFDEGYHCEHGYHLRDEPPNGIYAVDERSPFWRHAADDPRQDRAPMIPRDSGRSKRNAP